jgi:hypothetical protein
MHMLEATTKNFRTPLPEQRHDGPGAAHDHGPAAGGAQSLLGWPDLLCQAGLQADVLDFAAQLRSPFAAPPQAVVAVDVLVTPQLLGRGCPGSLEYL